MRSSDVNDELVRQVARLAALELPEDRAAGVLGLLQMMVAGTEVIAAAPLDEVEPELAFSARWV